jgi:hypothetical protein
MFRHPVPQVGRAQRTAGQGRRFRPVAAESVCGFKVGVIAGY